LAPSAALLPAPHRAAVTANVSGGGGGSSSLARTQ